MTRLNILLSSFLLFYQQCTSTGRGKWKLSNLRNTSINLKLNVPCTKKRKRNPSSLIIVTSTKFVHRCVSWPILKRVRKFKSFLISRCLLKCFKNQNKSRICEHFVFVNQSQQNSKNCWCFKTQIVLLYLLYLYWPFMTFPTFWDIFCFGSSP